MKCPNCGADDQDTDRFCSNCGYALSSVAGNEPTAPVETGNEPTAPIGGNEPTTPIGGGEPTIPAPPSAPHPRPGPAPAPGGPISPAGGGPLPPGGATPPTGPTPPSRRGISPPLLAALVGFGVVVVGVLVWFLFFKGDDTTVSAAPVASTSPDPNAVGTTGTSGATGTTATTGTTGTSGATGTTGTTTGTSGASGTTGVSGTSGASGANGAPTFQVDMCADVDDNLNCVGSFTYRNGWTIPSDAPQFLTLLTVEGLQPGDLVEIRYRNLRTGGQIGTVDFDPVPEDVLNHDSWILYTDPAVLGKGNTWTTGTRYEQTIFLNGTEVTGFSGPLEYSFR